MRTTSRAIVIKDNTLLVLHRNKFGNEYDVLVGGGVDAGETLEQALYRELQEESGVQVVNPRLVYTESLPEPYGVQNIFLCEYVSGEPALDPGSAEYAVNALGQNLYQPKWLPLNELPDITFRTEAQKQAILKALVNGFPAEPLDITAS